MSTYSDIVSDGGLDPRNKFDIPPAFPVFPETGAGHAAAFQGMNLRDYFAAKAMQGICANSDLGGWSPSIIVREAYAVADAMLKARGQ